MLLLIIQEDSEVDFEDRQCLLDAYAVTTCPFCGSEISTRSSSGQQQVLCSLNNEGGLQDGLDILPMLTEEGYLRAYPEERRARAFLEFCRQGDLEAIVGLLKDVTCDEDSDEDEQMERDTGVDVLRYQDSLGDMSSALHCAVVGGHQNVAWLLLLLASTLDIGHFPSELLQQAHSLGLGRDSSNDKIDIRSLVDAQGRYAEDLAHGQSIWEDWIGTGRLKL